MASQQNNNNNNNNNITKLDAANAAAAAASAIRQSSPRSLASTEEQIITSGSSLWQHPKHRHQLGNSPGSISAMLAPTPINCTASHLGSGGVTNVSRATPTSSDQINDYDHHSRDKDVCVLRGGTQLPRSSAICETEHDEEVIVDNADNDDCGKKNPQRIDLKRDDKNR